MNKKEIYDKMAKLMKEEENIWKECFGDKIGYTQDDFKNLPEKLTDKLEIAKREVHQFGNEVAANPEFFDIVVSWIIDIEGQYSECGEEDMKEALDTLNFRDFLDKSGSIPSIIQRDLERFGIKITDRGGGTCSWYIGIPCNNKQADFVCEFLHRRFKNLINNGSIKIKKKFWQHRLLGLYNLDEVNEYLNREN